MATDDGREAYWLPAAACPRTRLTPTQKIKIEPIGREMRDRQLRQGRGQQLGQERDGSLQHEYRDGGEDAALAWRGGHDCNDDAVQDGCQGAAIPAGAVLNRADEGHDK